MLIRVISITILLFGLSKLSAQDKFEIIYAARVHAICNSKPPFAQVHDRQGKTWLSRVSGEFHGSGVKLIIDWSLFDDPANRNAQSTRHLRATLQAIEDADLKIYPAVILSSVPGFLLNKLGNDHFQQDYRRQPAVIDNHTPLLNFAHPESQNLMLAYYAAIIEIVRHFKGVVEIIPNFSWDAETEYPHNMVTGYSTPMRNAFQNFLNGKYAGSLDALREAWSSEGDTVGYAAFSEIEPDVSWGRPENWFADFQTYNNPYGRLDWIEFKTAQLNKSIQSFRMHNYRAGYPMPVQTGCTFDAYIERRGWLDYTVMLKNADGTRVADIAGREDSFEFHANYIASIINFWSWKNSEAQNKRKYALVFSTESNWPGYNDIDADKLSRIWIRQLKAFYSRGADAHFVYGWADPQNPNLLLDSYQPYKAWIDTLGVYKYRPVQVLTRQKEGVYFSSLSAGINHGYDKAENSQIANWKDLTPYDRNREIVTSYMVLNNPEYLKHFESLILTKKASILSGEAADKLLVSNVPLSSGVGARNLNTPEQASFSSPPGKQILDRNSNRILGFIWRTRSDLQALFPQANKCDLAEAARIGWKLDEDFIDWCVTYGSSEYAELRQMTYENWHPLARRLWIKDDRLQREFPDGYHSGTKTRYTFLDFLISKANEGNRLYEAFASWPIVQKP